MTSSCRARWGRRRSGRCSKRRPGGRPRSSPGPWPRPWGTGVADPGSSDGAALRQRENRLFFATSHPADADGLLALEAATGPSAVPELLPPAAAGAPRVLVVDDDRTARVLDRAVLEKEGTEVDLMERGADDFIRKPLEPRLFRARVRAGPRRVELV